MARALSFPGKSAHFVLKLIPKLFFLRRAALLAKRNEFVSPATFVPNVLNTLLLMTSVSEFGAASLSERDVALSVALLNRFISIN
jgi:hypothetical protein